MAYQADHDAGGIFEGVSLRTRDADRVFACGWLENAVGGIGSGLRYQLDWSYESPTGAIRSLIDRDDPYVTLQALAVDQGLALEPAAVVRCMVTVSDGATSITLTSPDEPIAGSSPTVTASFGGGDRHIFPGVEYACAVSFEDIDGDATLSRIGLDRVAPTTSTSELYGGPGTLIAEDTGPFSGSSGQVVFTPDATYPSEYYRCKATVDDPYDGHGITIVAWLSRSAPVVTDVALEATAATACSPRTCRITLSDPDAGVQFVQLWPEFDVRWEANGVEIGRTVTTARLRSGSRTIDVSGAEIPVSAGDALRCFATVRKGPQIATAEQGSNTVDITGDDAAIVGLVVTPTPRPGEIAHCAHASLTPGCASNPVVEYEWQLDGATIDNAGTETLETDTLDPGQLLSCRARVTEAGVIASPWADAAPVVVQGDGFIVSSNQRIRTRLGSSVAVQPDRNGNGLDELVIGAPGADIGDARDFGAVYILDGGNFGTLTDTDLDNGAAATIIRGHEGGWVPNETFCAGSSSPFCGISSPTPIDGGPSAPQGGAFGVVVQVVEDLNGDGVSDLVVSAPYGTSADGMYLAGQVFVVDGAATGETTVTATELARAHGETGISPPEEWATRGLVGNAYNGHLLGYGLAGGDFDGDGRSDMAAAALNADNPIDGSDLTRLDGGRIYTLMSPERSDVIALAAFSDPQTRPPMTRGFMVDSTIANNPLGNGQIGELINVGDVDNDGKDDLLVFPQGLSGPASNARYLIPGRTGSRTIDVAGSGDGILRLAEPTSWVVTIGDDDVLDRLRSGRRYMPSGRAGDINADGIDDLIITSAENEGGANNQWEVAVIFGRAGLPALDRDAADRGEGGFVIEGRPGGGYATTFINAAGIGDVNHDGFDDVGAVMGVKDRGVRLYIAYGKQDGATVTLSDLEDGIGGEVRTLPTWADNLSGADLDGDGLNDVIAGMASHSSGRGRVEVAYGIAHPGKLTARGGASDDTLGGAGGPHRIAAGHGDDVVLGGGGPEVLYAGAGDDTIVLADLGFRRVDGGAGVDTLVLPVGVFVDLGVLGRRVRGIERLSIDGALRLGLSDVNRLSDRSNTVTVVGAGQVTLDGGAWLRGGDQTVGAETFAVYRCGGATVRLQSNLQVGVAPAISVTDFEVLEDAPSGASIGSVEPSDADGEVLVIEVLDPAVPFAVDGSVLRVSAPLDRETQQTWTFLVRVLDNDGLQGLYPVTVTVLDVNEPPHFADRAPVTSVEEGALEGTVVATVVADDGDEDEVVSYAIIGGNAGQPFAIDLATGAIRVNRWQILDYESQPLWSLRVRATDRLGLTDTITVTVHVLDRAQVSRGLLHSFALNNQTVWPGGAPSATLLDLRKEVAYYDERILPAQGFASGATLFGTGLTPRFSARGGGVLFNKWTAQAVGGTVNASLPITVDLRLPDEVTPGETITVQSSWALEDGASFSGSTPLMRSDVFSGLLNTFMALDLRFIDDQPLDCDLTGRPGGVSESQWCAGQELECADGVDNDGDTPDPCVETALISGELGDVPVSYGIQDICSTPNCFGNPDTFCEEAVCLGNSLYCDNSDCNDPDCSAAPICVPGDDDLKFNLIGRNVTVEPIVQTRTRAATSVSSVAFRDVYPNGAQINDSSLLELFTGDFGSPQPIDRPNLLMSSTVFSSAVQNQVQLEPAFDVSGGGSHPATGVPVTFVDQHSLIKGPVTVNTTFEQAYYLEAEGVVATLTLEDGSEQVISLGGDADIDVPAGADVNGDGRVDVSVRFAIQARLYNRLRASINGMASPQFGVADVDLIYHDPAVGDVLLGSEHVGPLAAASFQNGESTLEGTGVLIGGFNQPPALITSIDLATAPAGELCGNGADDDGDGYVDCEDSQCQDQICSDSGRCSAGACVDACGDCDDGIACTDDRCDATTRACSHTPLDTLCPDNGFFCDGDEVCNVNLGCVHTGTPCEPTFVCDEPSLSCLVLAPSDPALVASTGDSMSRAFGAICDDGAPAEVLQCWYNGESTGFPVGGDFPEYSWSTGSDVAVNSLAQRVAAALSVPAVPGLSIAFSGDEYDQLADQARTVCRSGQRPATVTILLGGNDVCRSESVAEMPPTAELVGQLRDGLDILTACLGPDTTIMWHSIPRADRLYEAGLEKAVAPCPGDSNVSCADTWQRFNTCRIVTAEPDPAVRAEVGRRINAYNEALSAEVVRYDLQEDSRNPNGVSVRTDWRGSIEDGHAGTSVGAFVFGACDISASDCFHPSLIGQNKLACNVFSAHPLNPTPGAEDCATSVRQCGNGILDSGYGEQCETDAHCAGNTTCNDLCLCVNPATTTCDTVAECAAGHDCIDDACRQALPIPSYSDFSAPGQAVLDTLAGGWRYERPSLWDLRRDTVLPAGWLVQSPDVWGQPAADLIAPPACNPASDTACDPDFLLRRCVDNVDCGGVGTCQPVLSTVNAVGATPATLCVGHSMHLVDDMYSTMIEAHVWLDVTSLFPPDGPFLAATRNALTYLASRGDIVQVRYLISHIPGRPLDTDEILAELVRDLPPAAPLTVYVGAYRSGFASWNHSKIIAADGRVLMEGGHNLSDGDYLRDAPVHDLSLRMSGSVADDAHRFVDRLWPFFCDGAPIGSLADLRVWPATAPACPPSWAASAGPLDTSGFGGVRTIPVGRLGALGANPSEAAQVALIDSAQLQVRIAQQDMGPYTVAGVAAYDWSQPLMSALARAAFRDVDVYIVVSSLDGRGAYLNGWTASDVIREVLDWVSRNPDAVPIGVDAEEAICNRIRVAYLKANDDDLWANGVGYSNHSKLVHVDDTAFYVGSHNLYPADLAEYGVIIDDVGAAMYLRSTYYDPMWLHSSRTAVSGIENGGCALEPN